MAKIVHIEKNKAGVEDLTFGTAVEQQSRNGETVPVTQINAGNMPFDASRSLQEALDESYPTVEVVGNDLRRDIPTDLLYDPANPSNINTVGDNMAAVAAVDANEVNINAVAANEADIDAVALNIANVNAVATNETNINVVNANKLNIDAVAANETNINAVNANKVNIDAVAANETNIDTVAANDANVTAVGSDLLGANNIGLLGPKVTDGSLDTAANSVVTLNGIYLGAHSVAPTLDLNGDPLTGGELYFNTADADPANHIMMAYNGTTWNPAYGINIATDAITFTNKTIDDVSNYVNANALHYPIKASGIINRGDCLVAVDTLGDGTIVAAVRSANNQPAIGMSDSNLANNELGKALTVGTFKNFDATGLTVGQILYPDATGSMTNTPTIADGNYNQPCAFVAEINGGNAQLVINFHSAHESSDLISYGAGSVKDFLDNAARVDTANTFTENQTISNIGPVLTFDDTSGSGGGRVVATDSAIYLQGKSSDGIGNGSVHLTGNNGTEAIKAEVRASKLEVKAAANPYIEFIDETYVGSLWQMRSFADSLRFMHNNSSRLICYDTFVHALVDFIVSGDITATGNVEIGSGADGVNAGVSISTAAGTQGMALFNNGSDDWLRLNATSAFASGIYCGGGIFRTDGTIQIGSGGSKFSADNLGNVTAAGILKLGNGRAASDHIGNQSATSLAFTVDTTNVSFSGTVVYPNGVLEEVNSGTVNVGALSATATYDFYWTQGGTITAVKISDSASTSSNRAVVGFSHTAHMSFYNGAWRNSSGVDMGNVAPLGRTVSTKLNGTFSSVGDSFYYPKYEIRDNRESLVHNKKLEAIFTLTGTTTLTTQMLDGCVVTNAAASIWRITFNSPMPDTNYTVSGFYYNGKVDGVSVGGGGNAAWVSTRTDLNRTVNYVDVAAYNYAGSNQAAGQLQVQIHR